MTKALDHNIIELFKNRDGLETTVYLENGTTIAVWNITWGYDICDEFAHITSNISPTNERTNIDFFYTNQISKIVDQDGNELFKKV